MDHPPSYSEVFAGQQPSAPLMPDGQPVPKHHPAHPNIGWNPNTNHYPQLVMAQPVHQQAVQPQMNPQPQQTFVIINQNLRVEDNPVVMICPHCHQQSITRIEYTSNCTTHMTAGILCMLGWCPCAIIPYLTDCLKDAVHTCSKCNGYIGTYRRSRSRYRY